MISCTQPTAAQFGATILATGGNAADAAIAVAAGMQLLEPCSTGLGGDCFALYFDARTQRVSALNGSGRTPSALTLERALSDLGGKGTSLPAFHPHTITVPGAAAGWCDALSRWGSQPLSSVLRPAIHAAEHGVAITPITSHHWAKGAGQLLLWRGGYSHCIEAAQDLLIADSACASSHGLRAPAAGELWKNRPLAETLRRLACDGSAAGFYTGAVGDSIVASVRSVGGVLSLDDLAGHTSDFPTPLSIDFAGARIWECPPNGQGVVALQALGILGHVARDADKMEAVRAAFACTELPTSSPPPYINPPYAAGGPDDLCAGWGREGVPLHHAQVRAALQGLGGLESPAVLHLVIESLRLAFADARAYVCDPLSPSALQGPSPHSLLDDDYLRARAARIHPATATASVVQGVPMAGSDTVSFSVVDSAGNSCSFINSNYMGFGTGLVPKNTGFSLQNRGHGFSLEQSHPNVLGPGKRPYHTIIPALATRVSDGSLFASFSCMGGFMQPQGHTLLALSTLVYGRDPQTALDGPRVCIGDGTAAGAVHFEEGIPVETIAACANAGHHVACTTPVRGHARSMFGRGQWIYAGAGGGVLCGGSDGRGDGFPHPVQPQLDSART